MMKEYQRCTRCIMDNKSDDSIVFDVNGYCNYCSEALNRMPKEYFPDEFGKKELEKIFDNIRIDGKGKKFDCFVGISGGVDSSYVAYLGYVHGLRMLAVHIDDGMNTETAQRNITNLCKKTNIELVLIKPDIKEYADLTLSFFKASVPNLAMPQDNILMKALFDIQKKYKLKYSLNGANFSLESILERSTGINPCDKKHILAIHKQFGKNPISKIKFQTLPERYILGRYFYNYRKILPLNYINYNLEKALIELKDFSGYEYYGGKHYENILTRFLQCYYLPTKFGFDKRKSHYSSMIVSGQMERKEAIKKLESSPYISDTLLQSDMNFLADYFNISRQEFNSIIISPPCKHSDYSMSSLNKLAGIARKFRHYLG